MIVCPVNYVANALVTILLTYSILLNKRVGLKNCNEGNCQNSNIRVESILQRSLKSEIGKMTIPGPLFMCT